MSMKKSTKAIIGTAAGAGALLGVFNTVAYECMLNIRLAAKIGEKMAPHVIAAPAEEESPEKTAEEKQPDRFFPAMDKWLPGHQPDDIYITNKKGQLFAVPYGYPLISSSSIFSPALCLLVWRNRKKRITAREI